MGKEKGTTITNQTTTPTPTPEETELNKLELERQKATQPGMIQTQQSSLNLINQLLTGNTPLPGFFGTMAEGISPQTIGTTATKMALESLPYFQQLGLTESGSAARSISKNIANELLFPAEQFNIGSLQNLLNLALSGQAQVQQPILASSANLGQRLSGLRSVTSNTTTNQYSMNPFLKNFQQGLGSSMGSGIGNIFNPQTYIGSSGLK